MKRNISMPRSMPGFLTEFRNFLMRGNIIELAVAFVMGVAFASVVQALVDDLIMPIVSMIGGDARFANYRFYINDSAFLWGHFVQQVVYFVLVSAAVFFLVVKPFNIIMERMKRGEVPADPATRACPECLSMVPTAAKRCMYCAQPLPEVVATPA